jgi:hypothetical protein
VITALLLLYLQAPFLPGQQGVVAGRVLSMDGSPAVAVRIGALAIPDSGAVTSNASTLASLAQTDASGRYRLERIPPGRYYITAGFLETPTCYPGVRSASEARVVEVGPGSTTENIDFNLARPTGVRQSGRVPGVPAGLHVGRISARN